MGQLQERYKHYREPQKYMEADVYPYFREIEGKQGTEVEMGGHKVLMFGSNAYTGLTGDQRIGLPLLLYRFLCKPGRAGYGGWQG